MKNLSRLALVLLAFSSCETPPPPPAAPPAPTSLIDLVDSGNVGKVRQMFGMDQDVNAVNAQGQTALHLAATKDLDDIVAVLLARGALVDKMDSQGNTALHLAVKNGSTKVLPALVQYGASLFTVDASGKSVLQTALQQNPDLIPKLVTKNTIGNRDKDGNTVMHVAAAQGLEKLSEVLIGLGADQQARNSAGHTPLDEALQFPQSQSHGRIAWRLSHLGAPKPADEPVVYFWQAGSQDNPSLVLDSGQAPLHFAASRGHLGLLQVLVDLGANVNAVDRPGNTPLHRAVETGDLEAATLLLNKGADINAKDFNSNSSLHLALTSRKPYETSSFLLSHGAQANSKNNFGNTPLHTVVSFNLPPELAKLLVSRGADVNARNKLGDSPLLMAVKDANAPMIGTLLELGGSPFAGNNADQSPLTESVKAGTENLSWLITPANKGLRDDNGNTSLHLAVRMGNYPEAVAYLLQIGSNPNDRNKQGQTPLHLAVVSRNLPVAQSLVRSGADIFLQDGAGASPLSLTFQAPAAFADGFFSPDVVEARDSEQNTPLFYTVKLSNIPMAQLLLKKGASVTTQNLAGQTVLHEAVRVGSLPLAALFLKAGAAVNQPDSQGNTPIYNVALTDSLEMGDLLVSYGADLSVRNKEGRTILQETVRRGLVKTSSWLLKKGADPNTRDNQGRTPLFGAVQSGSPEMVRLLLNAGANVNARDSTGSTVMHLAATSASPAVAELLMGAGADLFSENSAGVSPAALVLKGTLENWKAFFSARNVNGQNSQGQTALHLAVISVASTAAVQYLIGLGADVNVRNKDGKTPGELAIDQGRTELIPVLKGRG